MNKKILRLAKKVVVAEKAFLKSATAENEQKKKECEKTLNDAIRSHIDNIKSQPLPKNISIELVECELP